MKRMLGAVVLAFAVVAAAAQVAFAQDAPSAAEFQATTLHLSADGEVHATPDMATVTVGVQTEAPTAAEAMRLNAEKMTRVMAALRQAGLEPRDIRTAQLNLAARYDEPQNQPRRLAGYDASNQVSIRLRDVTRVGQVIDAAVAAGANNLWGISFGLQDPKPLQDQARLEAVRALQAKADLYSKAVGRPIARLVSLTESGGYAPMTQEVVVTAARFQPTPVAPGELTVRASVSGVYELAR